MSNHRHIPALDGLRGLAVLAVVVYHAWPSVLPGGWIGVSVFFTLSGFLITRILLAEHDFTTDSLASFWTRRARRLLPASLVTIAATVVAVVMIDSGVDDTVRAALAATLYVHNWWAATSGGGYWEIFEAPSPLAHMWSLAIEEQVYVLWPVLVLGLGPRRALIAGTAAVVAGYAVWWDTADAYYATPVRFAEVLAGAMVAVAVLHRPSLRVPTLAASVAFGCIAFLIAILSEDDPWVARGVLLGLAGAAAIVVAWAVTDCRTADRLFGGVVLGWLGRRSYAIYLFHWPLLVLLDAPPAVAVSAALGLAEVSHRLIERPIRSGNRLRRPLFALGGATAVLASTFAVAAIGFDGRTEDEIAAATAAALVTNTTALESTLPPPPSTTEAASDSALPTTEATSGTAPPTSVKPTWPIKVPAAASVLLVGDSAAFYGRGAFTGWVEANGGLVTIRASGACSPAFGPDSWADWGTAFFDSLDGPCRPRITDDLDLVVVMDHGAAFIDHRRIATGEWHNITDDVLGPVMRSAYESMVEEAAEAGAIVLILTPPPPVKVELLLGYSPEGMEAYNRIVAAVEEEPHVYVLDIGPAIEADPARFPRTDGLHLDAETGAVNLFVDLVAPAVTFGDQPG
ncbi:MAG: acyltransferase family protein [Acidimicrobiales bacterium]